ncbi:MAG: acetate--CoA ligase family protein [Candidatus Heimdallarchaeaceae archaeon]|jgi:acyl-CoA synthetase (NDP forming)
MSEEISSILKGIKDLNREILTYEESRRIMELAGIPLNKMRLATNLKEGIEKANTLGYPVVLKIISEDVLHKSDSGGVKVGINSEDDLKEAYEDMIQSVKKHYPVAKIEGVSIEEMVEGVELFLGINTDLQFGKMIAFGIGGVFVEVYKDVSFRLIPVTKQDVEEMIDEIEGKKILDGYRGMPVVNKKELVLLILRISKLVEENPSIKEMDLNPVVGTEDGLKAIDARIVLE